jgi:hypothetical protein
MTERYYFSQGVRRSSPWSLIESKGDLYISTRQTGGIFKASLHQSGELNFSFTHEYFENGDIEGKPASRHFGRQNLAVSATAMQPVFYIYAPINHFTECQFKLAKMHEIALNPDAVGTVAITIIHVPLHKRGLIDPDKIDRFLCTLCGGKYVAIWQHDPSKELDSYSVCNIVELGDINYDEDTREIVIAYSPNGNYGLFIDTNASNRANPHGRK